MSDRTHEPDQSSTIKSSKNSHLTMHDDAATSAGKASVDADNDETKQPLQTVNISRGRPVTPPETGIQLMCSNERRGKVYTSEQHEKAWSDSAETVQRYSDQMVDSWNKKIDNYLTFAGLFSGILTAFNVQSYILLQPAPRDSSIDVLQQTSLRMGTLPINSPFIDHVSTQSTLPSSTQPAVPRWAVWMNGLWFTSLVLSLSSAFLGIMVKQWLDEYSSGMFGASRPVARLRQYRLNNLKKWRVGDIVGAIPVLLQLALACFFAGLLILLWTLHHTLAIISSALVGLLAIFVIATTLLPLLPLFNASCVYLSPQTYLLDYLWQPNRYKHWIRTLPTSLFHAAAHYKSLLHKLFRSRLPPTKSDEESGSPAHRRRLQQITQLVETFSKSVMGFGPADTRPTRQGREQSAIKKVARELDVQILAEACSFTLHPEALSAATICLTLLEKDKVLRFFCQLCKTTRSRFGAEADASYGPLGLGNQHQLLWLQIMLFHILTNSADKANLSLDDIRALGLYALWGRWSPGLNAVEAEWAVFCLSSGMEHLQVQVQARTPFKQQSEVKLLSDWTGVLNSVMQGLLSNAINRKVPLGKVVSQVIASSYRAVRLSEPLARLSSGDSLRETAYEEYAINVRRFLECANRILTSSLPHNDSNLKTIRTYTGDVLAEMVHNLPKPPISILFANDLYSDLVEILAEQLWFDGPRVLQCIPQDTIPFFIDMLDVLEDWAASLDELFREEKAKSDVLVASTNTSHQSQIRSPQDDHRWRLGFLKHHLQLQLPTTR